MRINRHTTWGTGPVPSWQDMLSARRARNEMIEEIKLGATMLAHIAVIFGILVAVWLIVGSVFGLFG